MKKLIIILMAFCLAFSLVACGNNATDTEDTTAEKIENDTTDENGGKPQDTTTVVDDGKAIYKVKVVDEAGNAIVGAMVQLCKDSCLPGATDAEGVATFSVLEDDYKVSFLALPEGYTYVDDKTEFYFEAGSYEITLTLKAAE